MRVLVADDEQDMARALEAMLKSDGYEVDTVYDGQAALDFGETGTYDCIVLDIMMPYRDGLDVVRTLRSESVRTPILILTAKSAQEDVVGGLNSGADDYLTKPFSMVELLARVRALCRRSDTYVPGVLTAGDLKLDRAAPSPAPLTPSKERRRASVADGLEGISAREVGKAEPRVIVSGSPEELDRLVSVLVDNAVKYCGDNGSVRVRLEQRKREIVLTVTNPCASLTTQDTRRMFDRFYRADASRSRSTGGNGIGLSIAQGIVSRHEGSIRARKLGAELEMRVTLPNG